MNLTYKVSLSPDIANLPVEVVVDIDGDISRYTTADSFVLPAITKDCAISFYIDKEVYSFNTRDTIRPMTAGIVSLSIVDNSIVDLHTPEPSPEPEIEQEPG